MADPRTMFTRSIERFVGRVDQLDDGQWSSSTPCSDWDVRALVNHVTYEQLWAPHLIGGETVEQVGDRYDGDVLGDDPRAALRSATATSTTAFANADLDAIVHLSFADLPCTEYLGQMLTDAEVHGWDLAVAMGQEARLDPEVAAFLLPIAVEQEELIRGSGLFGSAQPVTEGADDGTRLLALLGRRARS